MNKNEKIYILKKCQEHFQKAIMTQFTNPYECIINIGAGRTLKKIIEEFIDCQSNPYYTMYQYIVKLSNKLD